MLEEARQETVHAINEVRWPQPSPACLSFLSILLQASQWQRQHDSQQYVIESHEREIKELHDALQVRGDGSNDGTASMLIAQYQLD